MSDWLPLSGAPAPLRPETIIETSAMPFCFFWAEPLKMSVCFHRMPKSSSWMQIASRIVRGAPVSSVTVASR